LANEDTIIQTLNQHQPQVIINVAAYTAVDGAEVESELCFTINARVHEIMATYMANISAGVFEHYSSDYVFADTRLVPYVESDPVGPINLMGTYAKSKTDAE
jgi:dTDP-4-dehydrorhamnose reductase